MSTNERTIPITDGGHLHALHAQLNDIGRIPTIERPGFRLSLAHPRMHGTAVPEADIKVLINGLIAESGDGNSWLIFGDLPHDALMKHRWLALEFPDDSSTWLSFHGVYNTRNRRGFIQAGRGHM